MRIIAALLTASALVIAACTPPPAPEPAATPAAYAQLMNDLKTLSADDMEGRDTGSAGGEKARAYIVGRLDSMEARAPIMGRLQPWTLTQQTRQGAREWKGVNILAQIPGTRVGDRWIVVTAHYDHLGRDGGAIHNGADDNASGVATALELARRLKARPPEHSVLFVFLDGEERGLLGARHFVEEPPMPLRSITLNMNFDMTARAETDGKLWVTGTHQHPRFRPILEPITERGPVSLAFGKDTPQDTGANNWVEASDHAVFHRLGLPFLYFGVDYHPDYHRPTDDYEKVVPTVFQNATELAIDAFYALDRSLDR